MTTARDIVEDALEMGGVIQIGATPSSEDLTFGLGVLNDMLHGWKSKSVDIGHVTLTASETLNMLPEHIEGVKMLLATHPRMTRQYGYQVDADLSIGANKAWFGIYAAYAKPKTASLPDGLKRLPNSKPHYERNE